MLYAMFAFNLTRARARAYFESLAIFVRARADYIYIENIIPTFCWSSSSRAVFAAHYLAAGVDSLPI
jgi:hypothetical protein